MEKLISRDELAGLEGPAKKRDPMGRTFDPRACRVCKGAGLIACSKCRGSGYI
jgi:DnaJ-class molecular chaperone